LFFRYVRCDAEALRLKPDATLIYYNRSLLWQQKANHAAALADFQRYLALGVVSAKVIKPPWKRAFAS